MTGVGEAERQASSLGELEAAYRRLRATASGTAQGISFDLKSSTAEIRRMELETNGLSRSFGSGLRRAFDSAIFSGAKLSDVVKGIAISFSRTALNAALSPIQNGIGSAVAGLIPAFGQGAAMASGRVRAFAKGGVLSGPTLFPMRGGAGLMGEAGPEAIMPLSRGPDGSLGVRAEGGRGRGAPVTVNITTRDAESFRRSEAQISAAIARAVRRGERNL